VVVWDFSHQQTKGYALEVVATILKNVVPFGR